MHVRHDPAMTWVGSRAANVPVLGMAQPGTGESFEG
jgi:hypothetical protein